MPLPLPPPLIVLQKSKIRAFTSYWVGMPALTAAFVFHETRFTLSVWQSVFIRFTPAGVANNESTSSRTMIFASLWRYSSQ